MKNSFPLWINIESIAFVDVNNVVFYNLRRPVYNFFRQICKKEFLHLYKIDIFH
jgi:hypothetical protein